MLWLWMCQALDCFDWCCEMNHGLISRRLDNHLMGECGHMILSTTCVSDLIP
jgi:hypothetical protein